MANLKDLSKGNVADDSSICISTKSWLQDPRKLAVSIGNMTTETKISIMWISNAEISQTNSFTSSLAYPWLSTPSLNFFMTVPSVIRLLFMWEPSFSLRPSAPVLAARSEPAKSTKF